MKPQTKLIDMGGSAVCVNPVGKKFALVDGALIEQIYKSRIFGPMYIVSHSSVSVSYQIKTRKKAIQLARQLVRLACIQSLKK